MKDDLSTGSPSPPDSSNLVTTRYADATSGHAEATTGGRLATVYDSAQKDGSIRSTLLDLFRYRDFLRLLVGTNVKARYKRSVIGVAWTLLNPLLTMTVLTIAFSSLFRFSLPRYPVYILAGIIFWGFFQQATMHCMTSLAWGNALLKRVYIPPIVFPVAAIGTAWVNLALSMVPLAGIMLIFGQFITPAVVIVPLAAILVSLFTLGVGLVVSALAVFFSDVVDMFGVLLRAWFFLTPIMYPESILSPKMLFVVKLNPMYHFMRLWRDPLYLGTVPPWTTIATCVFVAFLSLVIGSFVFIRMQDGFSVRA